MKMFITIPCSYVRNSTARQELATEFKSYVHPEGLDGGAQGYKD
jgi:hypothetical protein